MRLVTAPSGHRLLLIWRTEFLFYTPERRQLGDEWNQVRFTSVPLPEAPHLINHTLEGPLPFADQSFDAIYTFHVIEHLSRPGNERFTRDMYRLLKPGGIYRVATPDLEFLATEYLQSLREQIASASVENYNRYHWALCNLIDQCTRQVSGGEMLGALRRGEFTREHVEHMNGDLLRYLFPSSGSPAPGTAPPASVHIVRKTWRLLRRIVGMIRRRLWPAAPPKSYLELTYEKNLWLWDRISLSRLFAEVGLRNVAAFDHRTSAIPGWRRYNFDQSAFGDHPMEPSLYMEGTK
jgi:SAM-dependent methyltransferase